MGNHGWGMREMIIYLCIFAVILIFVAISINSLYKRVERETKEAQQNQQTIVVPTEEEPVDEPVVEPPRAVDYAYYHGLENILYNATAEYLKKNPTEVGIGILKIDDESLISLGFMDPMYNDIKSSRCTGYSNVYSDTGSSNYVIKSYITCDNYKSEGY